MEVIIREWGLWPEAGCNAECPGFKCVPGHTDCCCRRILFCQPDFVSHKSQLEEYITSCGHIFDFYPKFHCELNFIEQYWGAVKFRYRSSQWTCDMEQMECNVIASHFISAYSQGLTGAQAVWVNRKYHGHRTLPPDIVEELKTTLGSV
ncbi:uncharacterized protein F5147DRAFT_745423 [Suillus discolor]|uniref:Uncharacterized protein n=1 Tax=Suillus discolor TaxID=1912936 RepID=A0A9P7F8R6_9AGAM|nr:uncharacterized protein F5147DRAFT_745423 [Suillus discolor]KAG2109984.1 hypothetical protein F5147DRAFT_745423 [Suillus discolor]